MRNGSGEINPRKLEYESESGGNKSQKKSRFAVWFPDKIGKNWDLSHASLHPSLFASCCSWMVSAVQSVNPLPKYKTSMWEKYKTQGWEKYRGGGF